MKNNRPNRIKGQSLVETALVLPVLLLILTAIIDFSLLFNNYLVIGNASREGARKAAIGGADTEVISTIYNVTATLDPAKLTISISPGEAGRDPGDAVTVRVAYEYDMITPFMAAVLPGPFQLEAGTTMRCE
ncbi:MAG: TadE/TadG family type IV pilus assembly protein [Bacillota bacterium]